MQAATKLAKSNLQRLVLDNINPITNDIKQYLAEEIEKIASEDVDVQKILDIFNNTEEPLIFEVVDLKAKPLAHQGFNIAVYTSEMQDTVVSLVPASFMYEFFDKIDFKHPRHIKAIEGIVNRHISNS